MSGLFRKSVVLDKAADFRRVDAGVFRKGPANAVADVIIVVLGASEAELTQERPVRAVLILHPQQFPDAAAKLFVQQEEDAKERRESYKKMAGQA